MKYNFKSLTLALVLVAAVAVMPAAAQLNSNVGNVVINASLPESLTVTVNSGAIVNCNLAPNFATNACAPGSSITTAWVLKPGRTSLKVFAYFGSAAIALAHTDPLNTVDIPSKDVKVQVGGAGAFNPLSNANPFNAQLAGLQIGPTIAITGLNKNSSRADNLAYQIDTTDPALAQMPADTYTGTMNVQAQATP